MHADGDVVGEQGQGDGLVDLPEVPFDLVDPAERVERRGGDDGVGPEFGGGAGVLDDAVGLRVDAADQDGHTPGDGLYRCGDDLPAALIGGEDDLSR